MLSVDTSAGAWSNLGMRKLLVLLALTACGKGEAAKSEAQRHWEAQACTVSRVEPDRVCRFCQAHEVLTRSLDHAAVKDPAAWGFVAAWGGAKAIIRGVEVCERH